MMQSTSYALPSDDHRVLGDAVDAATLRVDQLHVRPIERVEIFVVETRPLAELPVVRLQRRGGVRVAHDLIDARAHLFHFLEVREFHHCGHLLRRLVAVGRALRKSAEIADDVGPAVGNQVFFLEAAGNEHVEVGHTFLLPTRLERLCPLRIGRPVVAHVDRRRRALEDVQLFRGSAEMRHALHGGRAGADHRDAFVAQLRQIAGGIAARVVVVPTARVERVALERLHARNRRQLRPVQRTVRHRDVARPHLVAAVRGHDPARRRLRPNAFRSLRSGSKRSHRDRSARRSRGCARGSPARACTSLSGCSSALRAAADRCRPRYRTARPDNGSSTTCRRSRRPSR